MNAADLKKVSMYGSNNEVLNAEKYQECRVNLPESVAQFVIEGGNHVFFGTYGLQEGDGTATITYESQIADAVGFTREYQVVLIIQWIRSGFCMEENKKKLDQLAYEYSNEGRVAFAERKLDQAALLIQQAINHFKESGNLEQYARNLNMLGVIYASLGNETMAIDYYLEGLECSIQNNFSHINLLFYNNIGSRYQELHEYERAISYFLKAEKELLSDKVQQEENYKNWCLVTYLNLVMSYTALNNFKQAEKYLSMCLAYVDEEENREYRFGVLIAKYWLCWLDGKEKLVYEHLDEILEGALNDESTSDYVENMLLVCRLLREMKEYDNWMRVIKAFEMYTLDQNSVYFQLVLTEMWMDYYKSIDDMNRYIHLCVDHAELYRKQKVIEDRERAAAIDIKIELQEKEVERRMAEHMSHTDSLTHLGNRYKLENDSCEMLKECLEDGKVMTVGVLDIDCFKQMNDTYGHLAGDECLRKIADVLCRMTENIGSAYRFGGDEFVILAKDAGKEQIAQMAESIKNTIFDLHMENKNSKVLPEITISQGYCCFVPEKEVALSDMLMMADKALYRVKENGRNGYEVY